MSMVAYGVPGMLVPQAAGTASLVSSGALTSGAVFLLQGAVLAAILIELGYVIREGVCELKSVSGCTELADIVCDSQVLQGINIGFKSRADGGFDCIADWASLKAAGFDRDEFLGKIAQQYSYITAVDEAMKNGYNLVEEVRMPDQSIKVVLRKH